MATWIFGYGSLVWRPDMPVEASRPAVLRGFVRRFWQGSPDHRGTVDAPGRVVTLVPDAEGAVGGRAYRIAAHAESEVLRALDHREIAGYERRAASVWTPQGELQVLVYFASEGNPSWLGPASVDAMAVHIARAVGRSGPNREYLLRLHDALRELGFDDPHVDELAQAVRRLPSVRTSP